MSHTGAGPSLQSNSPSGTKKPTLYPDLRNYYDCDRTIIWSEVPRGFSDGETETSGILRIVRES